MTKTVHILGEGGAILSLSEDALTEPIRDRLNKGYLKYVNADGTPCKEKPRSAPKTTDPKSDWVGWAVHISPTTSKPITAEDADALTKLDLIEMYGVQKKG